MKKALRNDLYDGRWLQYTDRNGTGYAQPDFFVVGEHATYCFETKLTQCEAGLLQISQLYRPLLRQLFGRPVVGVLVCARLLCTPGREIRSLSDLVGKVDETEYTFHWIG